MTDPIRQIAHPIRPRGPNSSFRNIAAKTALKISFQHMEIGITLSTRSTHPTESPKLQGQMYMQQS